MILDFLFNILSVTHILNNAVPDGSLSKGGFKFIQPRRSCAKLIHLVILQSLGDTTFFKRAAAKKILCQTN